MHDTLQKANIEKEHSSKWIKELVESYTQSLDLSNELIKVQVTEAVENLKVDSDEIVQTIKNKTEKSTDKNKDENKK